MKRVHQNVIATLRQKAKLLIEWGRHDEALAVADEILEVEGHYMSAVVALRSGDEGQALRQLRGTYRRFHNDAEYRYLDRLDMLEHLEERRFRARMAEGKARAERVALDEQTKQLRRQLRLLREDMSAQREANAEADAANEADEVEGADDDGDGDDDED